MTMGPWGQHYERTQTWWDQTPAWHRYLARCQFLLRQGLYAADLCYLQAQAAAPGLRRASPPRLRLGRMRRRCCPPIACRSRTVVSLLPDGMSYRLLVLPATQTMTPPLLRKIKDLVRGRRYRRRQPAPTFSQSQRLPSSAMRKSKSLRPESGPIATASKLTEHRLGQGRVVWQTEPEKVLRQSGIAPDFVSGQPLRHIHRIAGDADLYFVANPAAAQGRIPPPPSA